ncbi:MAG: hypothetical protein P4N60_24535 [Verrucomicrobiae bacterium]|nr:hypothetical protein [Verrucomicrobiae bacterium]
MRSALSIDGSISVQDGANYKIKFAAVPHVGEPIEPLTLLEQHEGKIGSAKSYEVWQVIHKVSEVTETMVATEALFFN